MKTCKMKPILWVFGLICFVALVHSNSVFDRDSAEDDDNDQIIGGTKASKGEFPYVARISIPYIGICGGTLIAPSTILTAAHCLLGFSEPPGDINIVLDTVSRRGDADSTRVTVTGFVLHKAFDAESGNNDIALIRIKEKVTKIKPIPLPSSKAETYTDKTVTAVGWGSTSQISPTSDVLLKVQLSTEAGCAKLVKDMNNLKICTVGKAKDACHGDSGGPLIYNGVQIGVISYSDDGSCANPNHPGIYVRLTSYLDWIADTEKRL